MRKALRSNHGTALRLCALMVIAFTASIWASFSGAIFTTTSTGTTINGNIYTAQSDVYLNGGPQNETASGLPDGTYSFQVTDPSGAVLLSTDNISCRQLVVSGGRVAGVPGGAPPGTCAAGVFHSTGTLNASNGSTPVQLIPFADTPNPGGEYKVWLTLTDDFSFLNCSDGTGNSSGFCDSKSKTDNFKIKANAAYVKVCKFNDLDGNGLRDPGEPVIKHWPITATGVDGGPSQTNDDGCVTFVNSSGEDSVVALTEGTVGYGWTQTAPANGTDGTFSTAAGVISVTLHPGDNLRAPDFGNTNPYCVDGCPIEKLTVSKTANPTLTRTFKWQIKKSVDKTRIDTTAGSSATFNYTVGVTHDAWTDSAWMVTGKITVGNLGGVDITNVDVTDAIGNGGVCVVSGGAAVTIPANSHIDFDYTCTYDSLPPAGTNTATASFGPSTGTAPFDFAAATVIAKDGSITVTDPLGGTGTLGTVSYADPSPTDIAYSYTVAAPSATCSDIDNTATFTTNDTRTSGSSSKGVKVCGGADLTVSKTAVAAFDSNIQKSVDKTRVEQAGGSAVFTYSVKVTESGWRVSGNITVSNPNDWEAIAVNSLGDATSIGGSCSVNNGNAIGTVSSGGSVTVPYSCTYASAPSEVNGINTATAGWDGVAAHTPGGSGSGTARFGFAPLTVTDSVQGPLGTLAGNIASKTFTYSRTITNTTGGSCKAYDNTATIIETSQSSSKTVTICNTATGALTMGFWQNKNGQGIITGGASTGGVCNSGSYLRALPAPLMPGPFQDLSATATCSAVGTYVTNMIKAANASGAAMNAMLKAQMLATALDVYFSDAALGGKKISAPTSIGGVKIDLTAVCKMIDNSSTGAGTCSGTTVNASAAFGGAPSMTVSQMLTYAAGQSNVGGSAWYGQVKTTQELAKNAFDAINNQAAYIAP